MVQVPTSNESIVDRLGAAVMVELGRHNPIAAALGGAEESERVLREESRAATNLLLERAVRARPEAAGSGGIDFYTEHFNANRFGSAGDYKLRSSSLNTCGRNGRVGQSVVIRTTESLAIQVATP